ncbi:MAG: hypothetical protein IT372_21970 [Polyangiaceae bacterium]|nr:hypothetical protein [Polyangiaceae bacterium]
MGSQAAFEVNTGYLTEALMVEGALAAHQIRIRGGQRRGEVEVLLDPNSCVLDAFGDPGICTLIAVQSHRATLKLLEERQGKRVFAVEIADLPGLRLRLALVRQGTRQTLARLLVMGQDGGVQRLITMEPPRGRLA